MVRNDVTYATKLGITQNEADEVIKTYRDGIKRQLEICFIQNQFSVSNEQLIEVINAREFAQNKLTDFIEIISQEKDSAVVKITSTYFDDIAINEKAAQDAIEDVKQENITNKQRAVEVYINNMINGYKNYEISEETASIEVEFKLVDNTWIPADVWKFGEKLGMLYTGQIK